MADKYWEFYRKQSELIETNGIIFKAKGAKTKYIAELWTSQKIRDKHTYEDDNVHIHIKVSFKTSKDAKKEVPKSPAKK
jgi:hypothetical protein